MDDSDADCDWVPSLPESSPDPLGVAGPENPLEGTSRGPVCRRLFEWPTATVTTESPQPPPSPPMCDSPPATQVAEAEPAEAAEVTYWLPPEGWVLVEGHLWCPVAHKLVATSKGYRHRPTCAPSCPLTARPMCRTYGQADLDRVTCVCGVLICKGKLPLRKAIYEHARRSNTHMSLTKEERAALVDQVCDSRYMTAATSAGAARATGLPILGRAPTVPQLPHAIIENNPEPLALSVAAVGPELHRFTHLDALEHHGAYLGIVRRMLEALDEQPLDFRYVLTSAETLQGIRDHLAGLYRSGAVPSAQGLHAALVCLAKRLEGRLSFILDGQSVSFYSSYFQKHNKCCL